MVFWLRPELKGRYKLRTLIVYSVSEVVKAVAVVIRFHNVD